MSRSRAEERPSVQPASDLHVTLAGLREQMEFMLRDKLAQVENDVTGAVRESDARLKAADEMIARLRDENARLQETIDRFRKLALDS